MKRGPYVKFSQQAKIAVAKYAAEHGVAAALRRFVKRFPELKESTIRTWRTLNCKGKGRLVMIAV